MNTSNPNVCLQLYFLWQALKTVCIHQQTQLGGDWLLPWPAVNSNNYTSFNVGGRRDSAAWAEGCQWGQWGSRPWELSFWPWAKHISCSVPLLFKSDPLRFISEQLIDIGLAFFLWNKPQIPKCLCVESKFKYEVSVCPPCSLPWVKVEEKEPLTAICWRHQSRWEHSASCSTCY